MPLRFSSHTSHTIFAILLDKFAETEPSIIVANEVDGLILTEVSGEDMIMLVAENLELQVIGVGDIDEVIMAEKTVRSNSGVLVQLGGQGIGDCRGVRTGWWSLAFPDP